MSPGPLRFASWRIQMILSSALQRPSLAGQTQGKTVVYAMVTSGEAGIDGMEPAEARRVREAEQLESARIVGVETVDFLGLPDGVLEYGVAAASRDLWERTPAST